MPDQNQSKQPKTPPAPKPKLHMYHSPVGVRRELFWQNVIREFLNGLASAAAASGGRLGSGAKGAAEGPGPQGEMFDGRLAVITRLGQRIPIADVFPVFACSIATPHEGNEHDPNGAERLLAGDVQCTVFQIKTPGGEVYTLPVHEITSIHALSEPLIRRMQQAAERVAGASGPEDDDLPFGFAAFTSLAQSESETPEANDDGIYR